MDRVDIGKAANTLLEKMWEQRHLLVPERAVTRIEIAEPGLAAKFLLINFLIEEQIGGQFAYRGQKFETAGLLDRQARKIVVSKRFPKEVMVFTAAHEIGHWVLHPDEVMIHRDRAVTWPPVGSQVRPKQESEADYFAACFLMPRSLVIEFVGKLFGACPLVIDDRTAFAIDASDYEALLRAQEGSIERARAVARASHFGLKQVHPLHKQFGVSVSAMAYRLRELGLVR
jgi:Zn-dependent peptidase ImmA (M78 family)